MRFILGLLLGYCIRGNKPLLVATLTTIAIVCFIVRICDNQSALAAVRSNAELDGVPITMSVPFHSFAHIVLDRCNQRWVQLYGLCFLENLEMGKQAGATSGNLSTGNKIVGSGTDQGAEEEDASIKFTNKSSK